MHKKLLTLLALIGLAGLTIPAHAQVLKGKEAANKASTKQTKAKKDAKKQEKASAAKANTAAEQKGANKKIDAASPK